MKQTAKMMNGNNHFLLVFSHTHDSFQLRQLLPALITCVVAKRLSSLPSDNHWALRSEAAQVLLQACDR